MEGIPFQERDEEMDYEILDTISLKLESLDIQGTIDEVKRALDEKVPPFEIVKNGLSPGMDKIGQKCTS
jgi:methanogenic corrinoid protein MtbC1